MHTELPDTTITRKWLHEYCCKVRIFALLADWVAAATLSLRGYASAANSERIYDTILFETSRAPDSPLEETLVGPQESLLVDQVSESLQQD